MPPDAGTMCLRGLISELNKEEGAGLDSFTAITLQVYAGRGKVNDLGVRCNVGGCEARSEIDPLDILASQSRSE